MTHLEGGVRPVKSVLLDAPNIAHMPAANRRLIRLGQLVGMGVPREEAERVVDWMEEPRYI